MQNNPNRSLVLRTLRKLDADNQRKGFKAPRLFCADTVFFEAVCGGDLRGTLSESTVRRHLNQLAADGIISCQKYARSKVYSLKDGQ